MSEETTTQTAVVYTDADIFRAIVIKNALLAYSRSGMKVNRAYTPTAMIDAARQITGKKLAARDYIGASLAIGQWLESKRKAGNNENE